MSLVFLSFDPTYILEQLICVCVVHMLTCAYICVNPHTCWYAGICVCLPVEASLNSPLYLLRQGVLLNPELMIWLV